MRRSGHPVRAHSALLFACILLAGLIANGCKKGGRGPGGPDPDPAVSSISPGEARAGAEVALIGVDFGADAARIVVRFGETPAELVSVANRRIVTRVPDLAPGPSTVIVTVGEDETEPVAFTVLRDPPLITLLEPDPVRAGATLVIRGDALSGTNVTVVADTIVLPVTSVANTEISVTIPEHLDPGRYGFRVETDGQVSDRFTAQVDAFTVTGRYELSGTVLLNGCRTGPAVGTPVSRIATVTDERPAIRIALSGSGTLQGIFNPSGSFQATVTGGSTEFNGGFFAAPSEPAMLSGLIEMRADPSRPCRIVEDVCGPRTSG